MKLINCLQQINQNSSEDILFVEEPWTIEANTQIITDERGQTVLNINGKKYTYFLEVFIINELFEDLDGENMTFEKKCQRIIEYASTDA
mgnify:CR=1 FL=1